MLVQWLIVNGIITLHYVNTKCNLVSFFTKFMIKDSIEQTSIEIGLCQRKHEEGTQGKHQVNIPFDVCKHVVLGDCGLTS